MPPQREAWPPPTGRRSPDYVHSIEMPWGARFVATAVGMVALTLGNACKTLEAEVLRAAEAARPAAANSGNYWINTQDKRRFGRLRGAVLPPKYGIVTTSGNTPGWDPNVVDDLFPPRALRSPPSYHGILVVYAAIAADSAAIIDKALEPYAVPAIPPQTAGSGVEPVLTT
jgi:hypothetical protein